MSTLSLYLLLKRHGAVAYPYRTALAIRRTGIPVPLAVALLHQESGGGWNVWGHDPTIFVGGYDAKNRHHYGELVTEEGYIAYAGQRGPTGKGGMQGVGPCQLTWYAYQVAADKLGGCWRPLANMTVGFGDLVALVRRNGMRAGIAAYNGTGPAAQRYADSVLALEATWKKRLG